MLPARKESRHEDKDIVSQGNKLVELLISLFTTVGYTIFIAFVFFHLFKHFGLL